MKSEKQLENNLSVVNCYILSHKATLLSDGSRERSSCLAGRDWNLICILVARNFVIVESILHSNESKQFSNDWQRVSKFHDLKRLLGSEKQSNSYHDNNVYTFLRTKVRLGQKNGPTGPCYTTNQLLFYTLYSLLFFSLVKSLQVILEISATYELPHPIIV